MNRAPWHRYDRHLSVVIAALLAAALVAGCDESARADGNDIAARPNAPTARETATPVAAVESTSEPSEAFGGHGKEKPREVQAIDEDFCDEIGGTWNTVANECDHPSLIAPPPEATDAFSELQFALNDPTSDLGVTEAEFVARWNQRVALDSTSDVTTLGDLRGLDLGWLYYSRHEILTVSLQVYLHDNDGELATVGVGSFPAEFGTPTTNFLMEAGIAGASPGMTDAQAADLLRALTAGHGADITGIDETLVTGGRLYRLIDAGGDNGVWLVITGKPDRIRK